MNHKRAIKQNNSGYKHQRNAGMSTKVANNRKKQREKEEKKNKY